MSRHPVRCTEAKKKGNIMKLQAFLLTTVFWLFEFVCIASAVIAKHPNGGLMS